MKIIHINKKDLEREAAILEADKRYMEKRAQRVYQQYLRGIAKLEANKKADS